MGGLKRQGTTSLAYNSPHDLCATHALNRRARASSRLGATREGSGRGLRGDGLLLWGGWTMSCGLCSHGGAPQPPPPATARRAHLCPPPTRVSRARDRPACPCSSSLHGDLAPRARCHLPQRRVTRSRPPPPHSPRSVSAGPRVCARSAAGSHRQPPAPRPRRRLCATWSARSRSCPSPSPAMGMSN